MPLAHTKHRLLSVLSIVSLTLDLLQEGLENMGSRTPVYDGIPTTASNGGAALEVDKVGNFKNK